MRPFQDLAISSSSESSDGETANFILSQFTAINTTVPPAKPRATTLVPCVEIPKKNFNKDDYPYLPGYSTVDHIRSKVESLTPDTYEVVLKSGDIRVLPLSKIRSLKGGRQALSTFNSQNAYSSSESPSTSSSEDELISPHPTNRRSRRSKPIDSGNGSTRPRSLRQRTLAKVNYSFRLNSVESEDFGTRRRSSRLNPHRSRPPSDLIEIDSDDSSVDTQRRTRAKRRRISNLPVREPRNGVRTSQRTRKQVGNMAERLEDDISEVEVVQKETKYSAAQEKFYRLPKDDPFALRHQSACRVCYTVGDSSEKGVLVYCQGCTDSYHQVCLGSRGTRTHLVSKVTSKLFVLQCRFCIGLAREKDLTAPHHGTCTGCKSPGEMAKPLRTRLTTRQEHIQREENGGEDPCINVDQSILSLPENVLFRCDSCKRSWHMHHLPRKSGTSYTIDDSLEEAELSEKRFKEYSRRWTCNECANLPGEIETLVAWRPTNLDNYTPGYSCDEIEEDAKEYLIKWRKLSYFQTSWMPGPWVWGVAAHATRRAFNKSENGQKPRMTTEDAIPEDYLQVDIVFDVQYSNVVSERTLEIDLARADEVETAYVKYRGLPYESAVWEKSPDRKNVERWQSFQSAYEDWVVGNHIQIPRRGTLKRHLDYVRSKDFAKHWVRKKQPEILVGGDLMDYQLEGLNWIYFIWYKQQSSVLADEMGLGKTIQVISFFATLIQDHNCWPFLVVVPNSTCANWRQEIKRWTPSLRVVTCYGSAAARKIAQEYEMFPRSSKDLRCHIVVTSYESMIEDKTRKLFSTIPWAGLVVDEGHRLKNDKNQLYETLLKISVPFTLLLTGTPLQNNIRELFNILQFCDRSHNAVALEEEYKEMTNENVNKLHDMIRPFFLRRTKAQVLSFLPPVAQIILPVSMTIVQKKLYKSILSKNSQLIKSVFKNTGTNSTVKQSERHNLNNILMQLRKCLCHPFVYSKAIEDRGVNSTLLHRNMVEASAKLQLLELLLPKLQERGHRVLIFSQFLDFLDIVEDFLDGLGLAHLRLDGSMTSLKKQKNIDAYNAPGSEYFAFLLSTRAGGVGINLATADTVIILDPDFNPHQDIQALSRAHRIGQKKKVMVFQLMTRGSAEEKIMQIGKKKMALDHVLIERMDAEDDDELDLEAILRHGAEALFDDDNTSDLVYDSQSVNKLIDQSEVENTKVGNDTSAESQFSFARVWVNESMEDALGDSESTPPPSNTVWEKILQERERAAEEEARAKAETFGRGKRKRQAINYRGHDRNNNADNDSDVEFNGPSESDTDVTATSERSETFGKRAARPFKRASIAYPDGDVETQSTLNEKHPCVACDHLHPIGYCQLRLAGVEHCGLCGIAHLGHLRTCPHLQSELQVASMLGSLRQSTEASDLVEAATKYLRGIRGHLVAARKKAASQEQTQYTMTTNPPPAPPYTQNRHPQNHPEYSYIAQAPNPPQPLNFFPDPSYPVAPPRPGKPHAQHQPSRPHSSAAPHGYSSPYAPNNHSYSNYSTFQS
ncbi:Chromatin remodeling complex subunit [Trichophyton interdigitale]|nr:Chromatin remodeling complex subunit [Trichophyton interdigitale]KAG5218737.1 Chromatin remodeling complex subunit [Trichophyton interdigitale]KAG8207183.1 Chromatin remodeling complex subunit [Trichophyton interdigitale]